MHLQPNNIGVLLVQRQLQQPMHSLTSGHIPAIQMGLDLIPSYHLRWLLTIRYCTTSCSDQDGLGEALLGEHLPLC
jgi:hypothetical protein